MFRFISLFTWWVRDEKKREWLNRFLGFAIVGTLMTLVTILLYYICFDIYDFPLKITYVIIYVVTVLVSYLMNSFLVFQQAFSVKKMLLYYVVYLSGMLLGLVLLHFMERKLPFSKTVISISSIPITMVWNFILTSIVLKDRIVEIEIAKNDM